MRRPILWLLLPTLLLIGLSGCAELGLGTQSYLDGEDAREAAREERREQYGREQSERRERLRRVKEQPGLYNRPEDVPDAYVREGGGGE